MKTKIIAILICVGAFVLYLSGCSKDNAQQLGSGITCDTTNVSYSTQVVPILKANCYQCHQGPGALSGFDLSSYDAFRYYRAAAIADITWAPNSTPMPKNLPKLSDCDINTIAAWINQGAFNN